MLFESLCDELNSLSEASPIAISFNMREFDSVLNFKKNNLHEYVQERAGQAS
jgi:5-carboxymethyl-2-hydroxymuconate isomerase